MVVRHEALRTTLHAAEGRPVQVVTPPRSIDLPIVDLDLEADGARCDPDAVHMLLVEEARLPFDLTRDLMLRAKLFRLHAKEHVLLLAMHQQRPFFGVIAYSVQHNHLHLLAEGDGPKEFSSGTRSLCIRIAKHLNRALGRKGRLFKDLLDREGKVKLERVVLDTAD